MFIMLKLPRLHKVNIKPACQTSSLPASLPKHNEANPHSTVDSEDVERHTKLLKDWWDPQGPMKALHTYNLLRVPFIRDGTNYCPNTDRTETPLQNKKILDVGCGGGILTEPLARLGASMTGLDPSPELIECAQKHSLMDMKLNNNKPNYICASIEDHAEQCKEYYDAVVASEVIEHVNNKELFVKSCINVLKPEGRIFFTTPNRTRLSQIGGIYLAEYVFNIVPRGTHQYEKFITPTELTFLLERNNCHVELIHGVFYNVLTNKWSWTGFQNFIFALQAVKLKN